MDSSGDHQGIVLSELQRPPSPFLTSAALPEAGNASLTHNQNFNAVQDVGSGVNHMQAKHETSNSAIPGPERDNVPRKQRVVCPYWYHYGSCTKSDEVCKYSHVLRPELAQTMAFMPKLMHDRSHACGLPLCRLRDGHMAKTLLTPAERTKTGDANRPHPAPAASPAPSAQQAQRFDNIIATDGTPEKATKRSVFHRDAPTRAQKRVKFMDYDDQANSSSRGTEDSNVTCFFWYHGRCGRSEDERTGFKCIYKHGLTNPPSMVQPPPGYVHRELCARDWCPGDAREISSRRDSGTQVLGQVDCAPDKAALPEMEPASDVAAKHTEDWHLEGFDDVG